MASAALALPLALASCVTPDSSAGDGDSLRRPQRGGVVSVYYEAPRSLDPADVQSVYESLPVSQIFDGLVTTDASLNIVPALASTWTISRDGLTYLFRLRRAVRFHDGSPLTADDVVYTFRRVLAPEHEGAGVAASYLSVVAGAVDYTARKGSSLAGVRALDPETIEIRLTRPYPSFLEVLTLDELRVLPHGLHLSLGDSNFDRHPIGTGPFKLASWDESGLRLEANPDYYRGAPYLEALEIVFTRPSDHDHGASRFLSGEVDVVEPSFDVLDRLTSTPGATLYRYQELSLSFLGLSTGRPQFEDLRVRQAIAHAIDRHAQAALAPGARREANGILPPGLPGYSPKPRALAFDPEESRRLLAQAGHPGGVGLEPIVIYFGTGSQAAAGTVTRIRRDLEAVGFRVEPHEVSWPELSRRTSDHDAPAFVLGWIADLADPDAFLRTLFEPGGSANYFSFLDGRTAELLQQGAGETNPLERARIYGELEEHVLELAPMVPLFHSVGMIVHRDTVQGLKPGPLGLAAVDFEKVWLAPVAEGRR